MQSWSPQYWCNMPVARNPNLPQINAGQALYGEIPVELLPPGDAGAGQPPVAQLMVWDGVQWHIAKIAGVGGLDITYNTATNTLEFASTHDRVYDSFAAEAELEDE
jgi:hypothetical protein